MKNVTYHIPVSKISVAKKAVNLVRTLAKTGLSMAPDEIVTKRLEACRACLYYKADGNAGLGECQAPGCGCTRLKLRLMKAKCPHPDGSRWPQVRTDSTS